MSLFSAEFLLDSLKIVQEGGIPDCLRITLEDFLEIHFPLKKVSNAGRRCFFFLSEDTKESLLSFTLHGESESPLASYSMNLTDIFQKLFKGLQENRSTLIRSVSQECCCAKNVQNIRSKEVTKRLIPLLDSNGRCVAFLIILMSFTAKGETVVKKFSRKLPEAPESSESEDSSEDEISEPDSEDFSPGCKDFNAISTPRSSLVSRCEKIRRISCPFVSSRGILKKIPSYPDTVVCHECGSPIKKTPEKVTTQFPDELRMKIRRETLCPLKSCKSIDITWKLPDFPPKSTRTVETQIEEESLNETTLLKPQTPPNSPKVSKKRKRGKKTGRRARKQKT